MKHQNHLDPEQLRDLLTESFKGSQLDEVADHISTCVQCREKLEALAAEEVVWQKATSLISHQEMGKYAGGKQDDGNHSESKTDESEIAWSYPVEQLLDPPSHPEMLGSIGGYDIEREIGQGGMGIVFKAFDMELNRPLAIKVLSPRFSESGTARKRFAREARAAAAVIHPNVVAIHGVNCETRTPYLVMPFIAGVSLQRFVEKQGPLEEKEIVRIALQVSSALAAAHSQGLVHRDIKPANILVESDVSRVFVTDFGLARAIDDASLTQSGCFVGTPNYMSPEQALGKRIDGRSDLFSLGSVIYFMATGRMPFRAESALSTLNRIANDEPKSLQQVNSDISRTLNDIVIKLLEKDPDNRFHSAIELHDTLEKYLNYLHRPDVSTPPEIEVRGRWKRGSTDLFTLLKKGIPAMTILVLLSLLLLEKDGVETLPTYEVKQETRIQDIKKKIQTTNEQRRVVKSNGDRGRRVIEKVDLADVRQAVSGLELTEEVLSGIAKSLEKSPGEVQKEDLDKVTSLTIGDSEKIVDLKQLEVLTNLEKLELRNSFALQDLSALKYLPKLSSLTIHQGKLLIDIRPLAEIPGLKELNLIKCNNLENIYPLEKMKQLQKLTLYECPVKQINSIYKLTELTYLDLVGCNNIDFLIWMPKLEVLFLKDCETLSDLSTLGDLSNLKSLELNHCPSVSNLKPLGKLTNLETLYLYECANVTSVLPLADNLNLQHLEIHDCDKISDISTVMSLPNIEEVSIKNCANLTTVKINKRKEE